MGKNPFKREKIVSKFDVSDIRKIEFVGSYDDDDSVWPQVREWGGMTTRRLFGRGGGGGGGVYSPSCTAVVVWS